MRTRSIRWQLPLSYAVIAFLAALSLSVVLLTVLQSHYNNQERTFLEGNARSVAFAIQSMNARELPESLIQNRLRDMGFVSETRITLQNSQGEVIADSGSPGLYYFTFQVGESLALPARPSAPMPESGVVLFQPADQMFGTTGGESVMGDGTSSMSDSAIRVERADTFSNSMFSVSAEGGEAASDVVVLGAPTIFGFNLNSSPNRIPIPLPQRSDQKFTVRLVDSSTNTPIGTVTLSEGPAYGREILNSVARGGIVAGSVAVLFAGIVGLFISRRLTDPLSSLTDATSRMAAGELSVRTHIHRKDELGLLGHSFNEMADRIESTVVTLRRFVGDAAHELHTPLTALRTNLELALEAPGSAASRRALEQVIRLQSLADDLLDLSRIEAQQQLSSPQPVNLLQMVRETSEIYASRAEQAEIEYQIEIPLEEQAICGDAIQLQRLLCNLLDNAIKFTPAGGVVTVWLKPDESHIELAVQDTGIGIPEDDMPFLFERFRRGRNTADYPGSGLGLAIVKAIATAHGGGVHACSNSTGTIMTVKLPSLVTTKAN